MISVGNTCKTPSISIPSDGHCFQGILCNSDGLPQPANPLKLKLTKYASPLVCKFKELPECPINLWSRVMSNIS
jgi:hypothetical protein